MRLIGHWLFKIEELIPGHESTWEIVTISFALEMHPTRTIIRFWEWAKLAFFDAEEVPMGVCGNSARIFGSCAGMDGVLIRLDITIVVNRRPILFPRLGKAVDKIENDVHLYGEDAQFVPSNILIPAVAATRFPPSP